MYQALYRKYRPRKFDEIVGQKNIVQTLSNELAKNKLSHAYLFTGPRGTGKTSIAKIFAKLVNCQNLKDAIPCEICVSCTQINNNQNTDVIEIDAASNNGVDEIREIRDKVNLVPSYGKYKVYIIDEVHMLTTAAFNALLKTLEEPPEHIIFILATTEPHKVPLTILSRCQRFDFKKISDIEIIKRLKYVCEQENIKINEEAIQLVAKYSDGGMRDSLSLLDQLSAYSSNIININDVDEICGTLNKAQLSDILIKISENKIKEVYQIIDKYDSSGKSFQKISQELIEFLKDMLIFFYDSSYFEDQDKELFSKLVNYFDENKIYNMIDILLDFLKRIKESNNAKILFELNILKMMNLSKENNKNNEIIKTQLPNEVVEEVTEKQELKNEIKEVNKNKILELKNIRINNTLCFFEKRELIEFKKQLSGLFRDSHSSSLISLIQDGDLRAKGKNNLLFVYKSNSLEELFNFSLDEIEEILYKYFSERFYPIAVTFEEWEQIKKEYNYNKKNNIDKYKEIKEPEKTNEIVENEEEIMENDIEKDFQELLVYRKEE